MCGIVGCILKDKESAPVLLECVKKLEYRGYDSVGIATSDKEIRIKKDQGKIDDFRKKIDLNELPGKMGIAHVRWATHGLPTKENAHPHTDCNNRIAVVHNGIIENFKDLRSELEDSGHKFSSDTDTEIIPHLIESYMAEGKSLEEAIRFATRKIKGSYALAIMSLDEPGIIIGVRKESPLIVGIGEDEYFLASDVPAVLNHTDKAIYLDNREMVILDGNKVTIKDLDGEIISKKIHTIDWTEDMAKKQGYNHFMLKEIHEQPDAVKNTLREESEIRELVKKLPNFNKVCFVACGTSYHASLVGKYLFESILEMPTDVILASEFEYSSGGLDENTLVILISQSGETADTLKALKIANKKSETLAIVNVIGSSATREAKHVIYTRAGPEIGVAATKTYVSQLTSIYLLALLLGGNEDHLKTLKKMPDYMEQSLKKEDQIKEIAKRYKNTWDFFFIGRGFSFPTAMEGALKLKEITYIHGEGYAAGELKHGPLALIDDDVPVVAVIPPGHSHDKTLSNMEEVKSRKARIIALGADNDEDIISEAHEFIGFAPDIDEMLSPIPYVIPLQLLAYYISVERNIDPDKPKNLAKCVTVE
ncbi:MAG: glutamine--fructose-6-phosphate transaminase (isomerizing) [Methanobacterium sp.]|nr:glutamine--fructose-6-phosphate transaminase (isomerizing) [Methanobacterium sp.]